MSGRHAAAVDVDDEALASTEPARPGVHRAEGESAPEPAVPRGKRAAKAPAEAAPERATPSKADTPPTASPAPRRRAAQRKDTA